MTGEEAPLTGEQSELGTNALRVKVAELLGWTNLKNFSILSGDRITGLRGVGPGWIGNYRGTVPDWPNDLNACAEFEKGLNTLDLKDNYNCILANIVGHESKDERLAYFRLITATAEQRCRAFIQLHEGMK